MNKILTVKQAATALKVNGSRVRQLILEGRLPAAKFANAWMIRKKDLAAVKERTPGRPRGSKKNSQASRVQAKEGNPTPSHELTIREKVRDFYGNFNRVPRMPQKTGTGK